LQGDACRLRGSRPAKEQDMMRGIAVTGRSRPGSPEAAKCVVSLAVVALLAACGGGADSQVEQSVGASVTASSDQVTGMIETKSGGTVHYACAGEGSPTILMEAGGGAGTQEFSALADPLAERTKVCTYDRPGSGLSTDVPDHRRTLDD
jgi:hypothetical protein